MYAKPTIILLLRHDCEKFNVFRQRQFGFLFPYNYIRVWGYYCYTGMSVIVGWCQTISSWKANDFQMLYVSIRAHSPFVVY